MSNNTERPRNACLRFGDGSKQLDWDFCQCGYLPAEDRNYCTGHRADQQAIDRIESIAREAFACRSFSSRQLSTMLDNARIIREAARK